MDFDRVVRTLNELLSRKRPETFSSSWILRQAPACYRFIQRTVRADTGGIDWDRVTYALDWAHQRRWTPGCPKRSQVYKSAAEVDLVLNRYRDQLYVFVAAPEVNDSRTREIVSIALVRVAQQGNLLARQTLMELIGYTVAEWLEKDQFLGRWRGYEDKLRGQVEGCIRRYRYSGSFIRYLYKTLEYAARGLRPIHAYSLDEPISDGVRKRGDLVAG